MHIALRAEMSYGTKRMYVVDQKIAAAVRVLTRRTTVDEGDINALIFLGHIVSVAQAIGYTVDVRA